MSHEMLQVQWMCSLIHDNANTFATKCLAIASNQWICVKNSPHISLLFIPLFLLGLLCSAVPLSHCLAPPCACIAHSMCLSMCLHCIDCKGARLPHHLPAQWYLPPKQALLFTYTDSCSSLSQCSWLESEVMWGGRQQGGQQQSLRKGLTASSAWCSAWSFFSEWLLK